MKKTKKGELKRLKRSREMLAQEVDMLSRDMVEYQEKSRNRGAWLERIARAGAVGASLLALRWIIKVDNREF